MKKEIMNNIFKEKQLDAIISFASQTRLWYANVVTTDGFLFIEKDRADLVVDGRYIEYAQNNAQNVDVHLIKGKKFWKEFAKTKTYKRIGIEKDYLILSHLQLIKKMFPQAKLIEINGQDLRIIKSQEEIAKIRSACTISLAAFESVKEMIKPGISEVAIDRQLNFKMKELGANKESFDSIVVSGPRGALPHGKPSSKKIGDGELVTIDFGAYFQGYAADITRTFKVGKVSQQQHEIFEIVKTAQRLGIEAVKPNIKASEIDKICRDYITKKGYGDYFVHSTGHGLGIDVHETPYVSNRATDVLKPGMVITVEPGIYIEEFGGVRFEDDILVTETGYDILSNSSDLQTINCGNEGN